MSLVAVADTGPLIHLAEIDALDLLALPDRLLVPTTVYRELEAGGVPDGLESIEYERIDVENRGPDGGSLDPGERAALTLAVDRDAVLFTDDLDARERATELGVRVHGTVGVVALGVNRTVLSVDAGVDLLRSLQRETSLYVSDEVVERGIDRLRDR